MRFTKLGWFGFSGGVCLLALCVGVSLGACKSDDDDDSAGMAGSGAAAGGAKAVAPITGFMGGTVTGTATFTQAGTDVTLVVSLTNCPDGEHPVHIHQGTSCADAMVQGAHWGAMPAGTGGAAASTEPVRGEGIMNVTCTAGAGMQMLTRTPVMPNLAWTVGGDPASNVIGHAFVVHNADMAKTRIGCGVIAAAQ